MQNLFHDCLNLILPQHCLVCNETTSTNPACRYCLPSPLADFDWRCKYCFTELPFFGSNDLICENCKQLTLPYNSLRFIWEYNNLSRNFIRTMKYKPALSLVKLAGIEVEKFWARIFANECWDLIIPIPANHKRFKQRGFNQSTELAKVLIQRVPALSSSIVKDNLLTSAVKRKAQADLSLSKRIKNLANGFECINSSLIKGKSVLLVDDVTTTGTTLAYASKALYSAGAKGVTAFCLAVSPAYYRYRHNVNSNFL